MRILHYIDKIEPSNLLSDHLLHQVEIENSIANSKIACRKDKFSKILKEFQPDIVNIHTCWQHASARRANRARSQGAAVIISPHWELSELSRTTERYISKFFKTQLYQRRMIRQADALLVSSEHERTQLHKLGWNKRIDVIPAPVFHHHISDKETIEQLAAFQQKISDTRYRLSMTPKELQAVTSLLHAGIIESEMKLDETRLKTLRNLLPDQWKRIMLFAADEEIADIIALGAHRLHLQTPDITRVNRYPLRHSKQRGSLNDESLNIENPFIKERLEDITLDHETNINSIATMLINAKRLIRKRRFSLRHLCDLYRAVRYLDYDEYRLKKTLSKMMILRFAQRITSILASELLLEEGFMPLIPRNDRKTTHIKRIMSIV